MTAQFGLVVPDLVFDVQPGALQHDDTATMATNGDLIRARQALDLQSWRDQPDVTDNECIVCGTGKHPQAYACKRCKRVLDRLETRRDSSGAYRRFDREARLRAMQDSWRDGAFHCFYTGIALIDDGQQWRDHRYFSFEHLTPGDEKSVVVTCSLVNRMKTDLTDEQFRAMVTELAKVFAGDTFDEHVFPRGNALP